MEDQRHLTNGYFEEFARLREAALRGEVEAVTRDSCVLCLVKLEKRTNRTKEHVFPKWYLKRAEGQKTRTFFASSTFDEITENDVLGYSHTIPLCDPCNGRMNEEYEKKVSPFFFSPGTPDREALGVWGLWVLTKCAIGLYLYGKGSRDAFYEHGFGWLMAIRAIVLRGWKLDKKAVSSLVLPAAKSASWHSVDILPETSTVSLMCEGTSVTIQMDGGFAAEYFDSVTELLDEVPVAPHQLRDISLAAVALAAPFRGQIELGPGARVGVRLTERDEACNARSAILDIAAPRLGLLLRSAPRYRFSTILASNTRLSRFVEDSKPVSLLGHLALPAIQITHLRQWPISAFDMKKDFPDEAARHVRSATALLKDYRVERASFSVRDGTRLAVEVLYGRMDRAFVMLDRRPLFRPRYTDAATSNPVGGGWIFFEEGNANWLAESRVGQAYSFTAAPSA